MATTPGHAHSLPVIPDSRTPIHPCENHPPKRRSVQLVDPPTPPAASSNPEGLWTPLPVDHLFMPLRFRDTWPSEVFSSPNNRNPYLDALYDFGLEKLLEDNGGTEDDSRSRRRGVLRLERREREQATPAKRLNAREARTEMEDQEVKAAYERGYAEGLRKGRREIRKCGYLIRGSPQVGQAKKEQVRLAKMQKVKEAEGRKMSGKRQRGCVGALCVHRHKEEVEGRKKQRLELALKVEKRKMEKIEAEMKDRVRRSVLAQSQGNPRVFFGRGNAPGGRDNGKFKKRSSAGSLTLVGTRETAANEKGPRGEVVDEKGQKGPWASVKRVLRSLRGPHESGKERPSGNARDGSRRASDDGANTVWWKRGELS